LKEEIEMENKEDNLNDLSMFSFENDGDVQEGSNDPIACMP